MSMPALPIAAMAEGLTSEAGAEPPDQATARPAACFSKNPSAIWERPALCTQRNRTIGVPSFALPSTRANAWSRWRANRSARSGKKLGTLEASANSS